jgi:hypothetical protein
MIDLRRYTGGLNLDTAAEFLPQGDYIDALNVNINLEGVEKILGTTEIQSLVNPSNGTNWVCGSHFDKTRQKVYYFIFNSQQFHTIVSIDVPTLTSTILFQDKTNTGGTSILGWGTDASYNPNKIIKDIKIIYRDNGQDGDLVYFIDPLKRPLKFNTVKLPTYSATNSVTFDMFKVIKAPPAQQPICNYFNAPGRNVNNLRKKLFQFKSRFIYEDDEKSVWSAVSKVPLPPKANDDAYYADGTKSNAINITIQTGSKIVKKIEVAARINVNSVWSNYFLVDTLNKSVLNITNNNTYSYVFLNDGAYLPIETEESNLLFDYVPDEANALELANGNTLIYAGIKEGLNRIDNVNASITVNEVDSYLLGALSFSTQFLDYTQIYLGNYDEYLSSSLDVVFTGEVQTGDIFDFSFDVSRFDRDINGDIVLVNPINISDYQYTVTSGQSLFDALSSISTDINGLESDIEVSVIGQNTLRFSGVVYPNDEFSAFHYVYDAPEKYGLDLVFTPASTTYITTDSRPCLKWGGRYKYGFAYYNEDGKTNGVITSNNGSLTADIGKYSDTLVSEVEISINHAPPSWASYYHLVRTKELTSSFSKFVITQGVDLTETASGFVYININNIAVNGAQNPASASIINYTSTSFVKGDRLKFLKDATSIPGTVFTNQYDYEILGVVSRGTSPNDELYIKLSYVTGMPSFTTNSKYLVEILRPAPTISSSDLNVYYEIGERFQIITDVNGNKSHSGLTQSQVIGTGSQPAIIKTTVGDYYYRNRDLIINSTSPYTYRGYTCMDVHFSDFWESAVWGQGRALVIDEAAKSQYFPALIRFSQSFIQGTNINNLNRFYPENFEEADNSFGDILRLKTRENFIRIFQRYKVGMMPIYRSIIVDNATSSQVAISEKLLNKPNYYAGEYGIDKYGSSLVSSDYGDYFLDTINRAIVRVSLDGMTNISDTYNVSIYTNDNIDENSYGYGYFNYENRQVVMLSGRAGYQNSIISYSESRKLFISRHGYTGATSFLFVNGFAWSFFVKAYIHNNSSRCLFYGAQSGGSITTVFNSNVNFKKTYTAIEISATQFVPSNLWAGSLSTGPNTNQSTSITQDDFVKSYASGGIATKEFKGNATIKRNELSSAGKYFGESMKGLYAILTLSNFTPSNTRLISVSLKYIQSPLTNM